MNRDDTAEFLNNLDQIMLTASRALVGASIEDLQTKEMRELTVVMAGAYESGRFLEDPRKEKSCVIDHEVIEGIVEKLRTGDQIEILTAAQILAEELDGDVWKEIEADLAKLERERNWTEEDSDRHGEPLIDMKSAKATLSDDRKEKQEVVKLGVDVDDAHHKDVGNSISTSAETLDQTGTSWEDMPEFIQKYLNREGLGDTARPLIDKWEWDATNGDLQIHFSDSNRWEDWPDCQLKKE